MEERFGLALREQLMCGFHVHVSVDSPDEGVAVLDRISIWLPTPDRTVRELAFLAGQGYRLCKFPLSGVETLANSRTDRGTGISGPWSQFWNNLGDRRSTLSAALNRLGERSLEVFPVQRATMKGRLCRPFNSLSR